jgi:hypothetical protein
MRRTSRRPWTRPRPLQAEQHGHTHVWTPQARENTLDFSSELESLEKNASETAASVKAAAAEDRAQLKQRIDQAQVQVQVNLALKDAQDKTAGAHAGAREHRRAAAGHSRVTHARTRSPESLRGKSVDDGPGETSRQG